MELKIPTDITTITCNECGKTFSPGSQPNGMPNGIGFETENGEIYNVCYECMERIAAEVEAEKEQEGEER